MYPINTIASDLRHEETLLQTASTFDHLQKAMNAVFDKINTRIEKNDRKLDELQKRIAAANQKISSLKGSKKSITIFSPAKFPSSSVFVDIPFTFSPHEVLSEPEASGWDYEVRSTFEPVSARTIQDKLQFFHTIRAVEGADLADSVDRRHGLGPIPSGVKSVNSLLLFNSSQNVYEDYKKMDRVVGKRDGNSALKKTNRMQIEDAPLSFSNRQYGIGKPQSGLFYTPILNEAPEIDLPMDLPDLPGIAGDVQFQSTERQNIAPSMFADILPDLPEPAVESTEIKSEAAKSVPAPPAVLPPPPPPPPPPQAPPVATTPQPPPPPPPMATPSTSKRPAADTTDARSNLMDAIRKAGGARGGKLRAAADVVPKSDDAYKPDTAKPPSGDLMADLHNKLQMRRKGISGAKDGEPGSVINRLSALIPPPPAKAARNAASSDEDDNDEWTE